MRKTKQNTGHIQTDESVMELLTVFELDLKAIDYATFLYIGEQSRASAH